MKKEHPEADGDGWKRFERAVDAAVKSGPKHRPADKSKATSDERASARKQKPAS